jgi:hypothetical protein
MIAFALLALALRLVTSGDMQAVAYASACTMIAAAYIVCSASVACVGVKAALEVMHGK